MAKYNVTNNIAIICLDNPPVNTLSVAVRKGVLDAIRNAENDPKVSIIILCGEGKTFCAGAEISEFGTGATSIKPTNRDLVDALETCNIPIISALHGHVLGGGLELALGCHYRVASSSAKFGLPEVKLGILPGAGATQRLPRLIGLDAALEWIVNGAEYSAQSAANIGFLDRVYPATNDIVQSAIDYSQAIIGKSLRNRMVSHMYVKDATMADHIFEKYKDLISKRSRGAIAPSVCLQVTKHATTLPYKQGMIKEEEGMQFLAGSDQSKALVYAFFAERLALKWTISGSNHNIFNTNPSEVKSVAVVGLGTMGRGIAISLLKAGILNIHVVEMNKEALAAGMSYILTWLSNEYKKGAISVRQESQMVASLTPVQHYEDLMDVDLVIEAVFESMELKKEIFKKLDKFCKKSAILATNTSALDIDEIASVTKRPQQVVGMHFFAPAQAMKLLENVRGSETSVHTIATAMNMGKRMGKITVLVGNCHGFVGNRMFKCYTAESDFLLEEGAYPQQVDSVLKQFGFAMGRYQVADLSGNDIGYRMRSKFGITNKQQAPNAPERDRQGVRYCPLSDLLVECGRLGYKSDGKGWFTYKGKQKVLNIAPEVTTMINDYRKRNNIVTRVILPEEILERMLYPMINEGFKILEEGIASNPSQIDLILLHGYAWPRHTGGPMYYAHTIGLPRILEVIERHWQAAGTREPHWEPSSMLTKLARDYGNPDIQEWMHLGLESIKSVL